MKAMRYFTVLWHVGRQMGWHYVLFRAWYWLQGKLGILKWRFPRCATNRSFVELLAWRAPEAAFFFDPNNLRAHRNPSLEALEWRASQINAGRFPYFSAHWLEIADWHTHPLTGYRYNANVHWSEVNDFSAEAGDIKFVWEKSRFTFLYDLIRYDFHFSRDQSGKVLAVITDWIDRNPVNCGPNWKCSQEIALRVLNWAFALHYYRYSPSLTQPLLDKILCSIYDQMGHVAGNIRFSQVAVRNNHVLTEALGLYTVGVLFPYFPESTQWRQQGKRVFENEIATQIASDGTYLQFSMNYHRVVVQLLTWGIRLSELNGDRLAEMVYERAKASLTFLRNCQVKANGHLPNYGHNDGALFFPLTECNYRDFRPQLGALADVLAVDLGYQMGDWAEDSEWFTNGADRAANIKRVLSGRTSVFPQGGYHIIRDAGTLTFLRCGSYYSRPFQADHHHLDIWAGSRNIMRDAGTWLYNADEASARYFSGTRSHNTVMIDHFDQMQKQSRFVWTHWITNAAGKSGATGNEFWIEAAFEGFGHLGKGIVHRRRVTKTKGQPQWRIEDQVLNLPKGMCIRQLWHPDESFNQNFKITATDGSGVVIPPIIENGWYSDHYGVKIPSEMIVFETYESCISTMIESHQ